MTVKTEMLNEEVGMLRRAVSTFKGALRKAEAERDSLRKAAQMALMALEHAEPWLDGLTAMDEVLHAQEALHKELSE